MLDGNCLGAGRENQEAQLEERDAGETATMEKTISAFTAVASAVVKLQEQAALVDARFQGALTELATKQRKAMANLAAREMVQQTQVCSHPPPRAPSPLAVD